MRRQSILGIFQILLLIAIVSIAFDVKPIKAVGSIIVINSEGEVVPSGTPLNRTGNYTYAFRDNISNATLLVHRSNITIDGAGFTLQGAPTVVSGINITTNEYGLPNANNVTIKNLNIKGFYYGIFLNDTHNDIVFGNNITGNTQGVWLEGWSSGNTISGNYIANDGHGVMLSEAPGNMVLNNIILNNTAEGVRAQGSPDNTISGNYFANNLWSGLDFSSYSHRLVITDNTFVNDGIGYVDRSFEHTVENNTVNGRPLVYLEDATDLNITGADAGQVLTFRGNRISIKNLNLSNTFTGITLDRTNNTEITGNTVASNDYGMRITESLNITVTGNYVAENRRIGIDIFASLGGNIVSDNDVIDNGEQFEWGLGIGARGYLAIDGYPLPSIIRGNRVINNNNGISVDSALFWSVIGNTIVESTRDGIFVSKVSWIASEKIEVYHNNFINNTVQTSVYYEPHITWDNGYPSGGNYWSNYAGIDSDLDGIGNTPYFIYSDYPVNASVYADMYPLMGPISIFDAGTWNNKTYDVEVVSNSSVTNFSFNHSAIPYPTLSFDIDGANDTIGFSRVAIPKSLMWCDNDDDWVVIVGGQLIQGRIVTEDANYTYIFFLYGHSTKTVQIKSTGAVPETQSLIMLSLLITATTLTTIVYRKKQAKRKTI